MKWSVGASTHGCWLGHYEADKQIAINRFVKPGMKVFDVGANAGFYTLAFSRLVGERGHVWAFEPFAENVQALRRHVSLNRLKNVTVVQTGVSIANGTEGFEVGASGETGRLSSESRYLVSTIALDGFCAALGIDGPDFIKIDIEGGEGRALEGAAKVLSSRRAVIALALHGRQQEDRCRTILEANGYSLQYLTGEGAPRGDLASDEVIAVPASA